MPFQYNAFYLNLRQSLSEKSYFQSILNIPSFFKEICEELTNMYRNKPPKRRFPKTKNTTDTPEVKKPVSENK